MNKWFPFFLIIIVTLPIICACGKEDAGPVFKVDFSFEFIDENNVRFTNQSEGEYYLLDWDFGNGETASNTEKNRVYDMYYPQSGAYSASLTVIDFDGNRETVSKDVSITNDDLVVSFTATVNVTNPNKVNLVNTSVGEFSSFKWIYRNKVIENETNAEAYFPFSGTYEIELQVTKGTDVFSQKQSVNISTDDPEYVNNFTLSWADEFESTAVNTSDWTFETGASGWGNNELQNYTNGANAEIKDGILILTAKKVNDNTSVGSYTSTRLITKGEQEFTYGKMEICAKLPAGRGIWPAIWMLGADIGSVSWPACGEIDIMEYVGYEPNTVHATVHTTAGSGSNGDGNSKTLETAEEEFHIYGLIWTEKELVFYTDSPENITHRYAPSNKTDDNWPFNKPQFFILNIAVGGNWGGAQGIDNSIFPQSMEIDYVRVYQPLE
ncbi:family 16 glycosylhydrolase [Prolixibacteraceae bacterium Z1-6]|uniref:Family 16 glycosylhydrolase n=1 Tax=Draconibacterium aestuarii TaxID=2998507 RepID=A0A9X3J640_9BACT|nr:family 16 glycosylhydrolase [Prolixibacteraceae bacterium Z1-6]